MSDFVHSIYWSAKLGIAIIWYSLTGKNRPDALAMLVALHSYSNGKSTRLVAKWLGHAADAQLEHAAQQAGTASVFQGVGAEGRRRVVSQIEERGYSIFPQRLPAQACEALLQFARSAPGEEWTAAGPSRAGIRFDQLDAKAAKLQFSHNQLIELPEVQSLIADPALLSIFQAYLGRLPVFDAVGMWWSIASDAPPSAEVAQMFHYDLDRPRWLKLFVYLTDVDAQTGPHVYATGSHAPAGHRAELLRRGYARIPDADVEQAFGKDQVVELCGPAGSILLVDTIGMHKGKMPRRGNRLVLELQFSSSLFGANYPAFAPLRAPTAALQQAAAHYPAVYQRLGAIAAA
jgi:hypothetical protein